MSNDSGRAPGRWRDRALERYLTLVAPGPSGLPNWRVVTWFPALAALGVLVLVILNISGTSSGMFWYSLGTGDDPRLLLGSPKPIRSDEWLVQQSWVVSQSNTGYGSTNPTFPGGSDMTLLNELPSWHWSSAFRPHLWGYLLFGLDVGVAWHWWVPALALVSGCYLFMVSLLPRRPWTAAFFAVAMYFTPLLQWFYTPSSVWPVAWSLLAAAGMVWIVVDNRTWVRVTWSVVLGYTAVTVAMGLYVPFILPGVLIVVAFSIGLLLRHAPWRTLGVKPFLRRLLPLGVAAFTAVAVVALWVVTRWATFDAIQSTLYPGTRRATTGSLLQQDPLLTGLGGAPWGEALRHTGSSVLGGNSSEGSSVILLSVFLVPGLIWFVCRSIGRGKRVDWLIVCSLSVLGLFVAYFFIPGWDAVAHLIQLDRVEPNRLRIGFAVLLPLYAALVIDHVDTRRDARNWIPGLVSTAFTCVVIGGVFFQIKRHEPSLLDQAPTAFVIIPLLVSAVFLLFLRRAVALGAAFVMLASMLITVGVNPLYRGIFDLSETEIGQAIMRIDAEEDGEWLGMGGYVHMALLMQTGVGSFSGVQNYPSDTMWQEIDPDREFEFMWNRLAHIQWTRGDGEPTLTNPSPDVVVGTFDPCSAFAQENVDYLLTSADVSGDECLIRLEDIEQGPTRLFILRVVPPG